MSWELTVARRYLRARRKQIMMSVVTAISVTGITVGVMALVIALGLMSGFQNDIKAKILGSNAHVLVFPWAEQRLEHYDDVVAKAEKVEPVIAAAPVIYERGMALNERTGSESAILVKGIVPGREGRVTDIRQAMMAGSLDDLEKQGPGPAPIILGDELAKQLDVLPGDEVRIVSLRLVTGPGGMATSFPANRVFRVAGIFHTGMFDYDSEWGYVALPLAQQFYRMAGRVSLVEVRLAHPDLAREAGIALGQALGSRYRVQSWMEMNKPFFSALKIEKLLLFLVISLIGIVAALNIATTLVMAVMEKGRDIAILMAMGARGGAIMRIFIFQGIIIGAVGTALGLSLGTLACHLMNRYQLIKLSPEVYYVTYVPFRIEPYDFLLVAASAMVISFVATIYPAWHASRLSPCEALRYE